jgi:hypothetical protein
MGKLFNPADYNLVANPSLPKTNSSWPLWRLLMFCAAVVYLYWAFTPKASLTHPVITFSDHEVTATSVASNQTGSPKTLNVRISIGLKGMDTEYGSGQFYPYDHRDVSAVVPAYSRLSVSCVFAPPKGQAVNAAEAQIVSGQ